MVRFVTLKTTDSKKDIELEFGQAVKCLNKWPRLYSLNDDKYEILEGELIIRRSKKTNSRASKRETDRGSEEVREQD